MKSRIASLFFHANIAFQTWRKVRQTRRVFALTSGNPHQSFQFGLVPAFADPIPAPSVRAPVKWRDYRGYAYAVLLLAIGLTVYSFWPKISSLKASNFSLVVSEDPSVILPDPLKTLTPGDTLRATMERSVDGPGDKGDEKESSLDEAQVPEEENEDQGYSILPEGLHFAIASKWDKTFRLYTLNNFRWKLVKEWPMLYGRKEGNKMKQGDLKTPEGNYWVNNILPGPNVGSLYGALIFTLNYPNQKDRRSGKTGGGIWIHGNEFGTELQTTRGCIKLSNHSILEMFSYVKGSIPVMVLSAKNRRVKPEQNNLSWIEREYGRHVYTRLKPYRDSGRQFSLEEMETIARTFVSEEDHYFLENPARELNDTEIAEILQSVEEWKNAWSGQDFSDYSLSYHNEFKTRNGADRSSYLSRKKDILSAQDSIRILLENIEVMPIKDSAASVKFSQNYKSYKSGKISHSSVTKKDLWLKKSGGKWQIIKE